MLVTFFCLSISQNVRKTKRRVAEDNLAMGYVVKEMTLIMEPDSILTASELAAVLKVSKDTVYAMVHEHKIPYKRVRHQIRFLGWQISKWLEDGSVIK